MKHAFFSKIKLNRLTEDEIIILIPKIKNGDLHAINRAAEGYLGLVLSITSKFSKQIYEEIVSEAIYGLVRALNNFKSQEHNNLTGYVISWIQGRIKTYIRNLKRRKVTVALTDKTDKATPGDQEIIDIRDFLEKCFTNDFERTVITLREQGYNDKEIADKLTNVSQTSVFRARNSIEDKLVK